MKHEWVNILILEHENQFGTSPTEVLLGEQQLQYYYGVMEVKPDMSKLPKLMGMAVVPVMAESYLEVR